MSDKIAAIATGHARTGIGVLRLSGDGCIEAAEQVFRLNSGRPLSSLSDRKLALGTLFDAQGRPIDHCMAFISRAPHSYTGEDTAEIQCHGSPAALTAGLEALFAAGFRQARPGEFTRRAFLNGQMDLTQAEAVIDLIDAETADAAANAAGQVAGAIRKKIDPIYDGWVDLCAHFHAVLDYPDEDIDPFTLSGYEASLTESSRQLTALLSSCRRGRMVQSGIKAVILGSPNAGKSSLINRIAGEERSIVSDIAGTTRDAVDSQIENRFGKFLFIDTAGLRRKSRVAKAGDDIERYSIIRAEMAIDRADVCVIMIDGVDGYTEQDAKVAGMAHNAGKACIVAVNKWDAVEKDDKTMDKMRSELMNELAFMSYAPIIFLSAKTGSRVERLFELIKFVNDQNNMRISTGMLNDLLADATARVQPPTDKGKRLKIYYITQASTKPPTFVCFCNNKELFHFSYQRYLENQIRSTFGLEGTPVRMVIRERGE